MTTKYHYLHFSTDYDRHVSNQKELWDLLDTTINRQGFIKWFLNIPSLGIGSLFMLIDEDELFKIKLAYSNWNEFVRSIESCSEIDHDVDIQEVTIEPCMFMHDDESDTDYIFIEDSMFFA